MKKVLSNILIGLLLIFMIVPSIKDVSAAVSSPDIAIESFFVDKSYSIGDGEVIKISNIMVKSLNSKLTSVTTIIDENRTSSFTIQGGTYSFNLGSDLDVGAAKNCLNGQSISLQYNGGDDTRIPITFYYTGGSTTAYIKIQATPNSTVPKPETPDTTKYIPKLSIVSGTIPTVNPGGTVNIPMQIKNSGSYEARNIDVIPQIDGDSPLEMDSLNLSQHLDSIGAGKTTGINFSFRVSETAVPKSYPVKVKFEFENGYRDKFTYESTIYVKVTGQTGTNRILVKDIYWGNPVIIPGETTPLYVKLYNPSPQQIKDIKTTLDGLKEDGFTINGGSSSQYTGSLNKGEEVTLTYYLMASKKMLKGNYPLTLILNYKDYTGKDCPEDKQQFFIPVQGDDAPVGKTVPKIILDQYSSSPTIVKAGQNFQLNLSFLNTSETKEVKNIKVYLTVNETVEGANVFTPVNSSNTFYIDKISPKGRVAKSLTLFTIPDAKQKTYTITANFEYEDAEGTEYKPTELIGIPVTQQTNVDTSEIAFPPEAYTGSPVPVSFDFYNTGKTLLRNFMIKLEGDFQSQNGSYFVGNFDVGASDHFEGMIIPSAPGQVAGAIVISFDDPTGQKNEIRKDFTFNVMEMPMEPMPQDPGNMPQIPKETGIKALLKNKFLWIGVGIVIVTVVGFVIIRKRILKKREDMTLDE